MDLIDRAYVDEVVAQMRADHRRDWLRRRFIVAPKRTRLRFRSGLSDSELIGVEERFGFRFPPDLAAFLRVTIPVASYRDAHGMWRNSTPDWRLPVDDPQIRRLTGYPAENVLFDIEHSGFWWTAWGPKPRRPSEAIALASERISAAPTLIPLGGTKFLAGEPGESGNPVFFLHQSEIHCVARSLTFFHWHVYGVRPPGASDPLPDRQPDALGREVEFAAAREIPFWTDLARWNDADQPGPEAARGTYPSGPDWAPEE